MMENMDISCGEVEPGNESAMSVDEAMDVCSEYETSQEKECFFNASTTVQDANYSTGSTSNNATSEMGDSANTTVLLNNSFPKQQEIFFDCADKVVRFPLANAKECNQSTTPGKNNLEIVKTNLLTSPISNNTLLAGKENVSANSQDNPLFAFPAQVKRLSDTFPLDRTELLSMAAPKSTQGSFALEEEHFTSGSDYIFSATDFDCLLSRGSSQAANSAETVGPTSGAAAAALPRDSVLLNFDPLLRRQTIAKPADNGFISNLETTSACLALVDFAEQQQQQQQPQNNINSTPLIPQLDKTLESLLQDPETTNSVISLSPEVQAEPEQLQETLTAEETFTASEEIHETKPSEPCLLDKTIVETKSLCNSESINLANPIRDPLPEEEEIAFPAVHSEQLPLSEGSLEEAFAESVKLQQQQNTEDLFGQTDRVCEEVLPAESVQLKSQPETVSISPPEKNDAKDTCPQEEVIEQAPSGTPLVQDAHHKTNLDSVPISSAQTVAEVACQPPETIEHVHPASDRTALLLKSQSGSAPDAKSEDDIDIIAKFASAPVESDALIFNKMLAEPIQEKQNSTIHNMSDDRMAQHEEDHVETGKKMKSEDVNIADMEKKMHDVELREENMLKRITEKDKTISKMSNVVEAYERTIAELISEKEMLIRNHELECENLKQDNEINAQHLESLEKTFSNLYAKYERMKKNAIKYKEHEEKLLEKVMKLEECLRAQEQRYEKMKSHAMSQLEIANTKIDEAVRHHSQESAKLKAQIKKEELYRISINEQLIQKSKENEELVKICDELISDTN